MASPHPGRDRQVGAQALGQPRRDRLALDTGFQDIGVPLARRHAPPSFAVMIGGLIFAVTGIGLSLSGGWFHATRHWATDAMVVIDAQGLIRSFSLAAGAAVLADLRRVNSFNE